MSTSIGISTMSSPFRENITTIVNNKAINVKGEIAGINVLVYQSSPFNFTKTKRDKIPNTNGIPKYMATLSAIVAIEISTIAPSKPNRVEVL